MQVPPLKIVISGGGTGGHIFPALAIADKLTEMNPGTDILFIGALGRMEMEKIPQAGYPIIGLPISGISRTNITKNISLPFKIIKSLLKAGKAIRNFKPDVIVGVGGYSSGPTLFEGVRKKVPTLIHEQNAFPGITNKILARFVNKVCVAYPDMKKYFPKQKIVVTGNPVRNEIQSNKITKGSALKYFQLDEKSPFTILVIGGSLGAKTINESISGSLKFITERNLNLIWQTGKNYYAVAKRECETNARVKVYDFITKMDYAYSAADAVISRAGAISVAELCVIAKPAILIPSPNVAENHQMKNAMELVKSKAAILIEDKDARNKISEAIEKLFADENLRRELSGNIGALAIRNSSELIAHEIIQLAAVK